MFPRVLHASMTEDFQASALRVIHEEQRNPIGGIEVAGGEQLAVALVIGKGKRGRPKDTQKSWLATTVLDIGPARVGDCGHIEAVTSLNEADLIVGKRIVFRRVFPVLGAPIVMLPGPTDCLS
jgi:hypothetical protein